MTCRIEVDGPHVRRGDRDSYLVVEQLRASKKAVSKYREFLGDTAAAPSTQIQSREILKQARALVAKRIRSMPVMRANYEQALRCYTDPGLLDAKEFAAVSYVTVINLLRDALHSEAVSEQELRLEEARQALALWSKADQTAHASQQSDRARRRRPRDPNAPMLTPESMLALAYSVGHAGGLRYEDFIAEAGRHFQYSRRPLAETWSAVMKLYPAEAAKQPYRRIRQSSG